MKTLHKNYKLIIVMLLFIPILACSSDDDSSNETDLTMEEVAELLVTDKWFLDELIDNSVTPPAVVTYGSCLRNRSYSFFTDGTLTQEWFYPSFPDGDCTSNDRTYTYSLSEDGTQITTQRDDTEDIEVLIIESISSTSLSLYLEGSDTINVYEKRD